jgi:hypothetical protein
MPKRGSANQNASDIHYGPDTSGCPIECLPDLIRKRAYQVFENLEVAPRLLATGRMGTLEFIDASAHQTLRSALSALPGG